MKITVNKAVQLYRHTVQTKLIHEFLIVMK